MPLVEITSTAGPARVWYSISTPATPSAATIEPGLPCLVLLHPVFCASEIWHPQLVDPALRQFNIIALDARMHGRTEGLVREDFDFNDAAEDVYQVLKKLQIPPCIVAGISMGATIGIRMAALHPEQVKGLFLISLLPPTEPPDVAAGRREVWETFAEGVKSDDAELVALGASGAAQLAFGESTAPFIQRILPPTVRLLAANCKSDPAVLRGRHLVTVELFINRGGLTAPELRRITDCPVKMLWAGADVAYGLGSMLEKKRDLDEGGLDVELIEVKGAPHFANVTHPHKINPLLAAFVRARRPALRPAGRSPAGGQAAAPPPPPDVASPFEPFLDPAPGGAAAVGEGGEGREEEASEDDDDDDEGAWA